MFRQQIRLSLFAVLAAFMLALTGCGGGGGGGEDPPMMPEPPPPDPQMVCEDAGGRYNADGTCTSAEELTMERQQEQRTAISMAIGTATTAVNAVNNDSTDAEVSAADTAIAAAKMAIANAADLPQAEKDANTGTVNALDTLLTGAKTARMDAMDEDDRIAREAMAATAAKLYNGISAPIGDLTDGSPDAATDRAAAYGGTNDSQILVSIGDGTATPTAAITLSEDEDTMVDANHGWAGKRYADAPGGDSVEAIVYSNVEAPTPGRKFGSSEPGTGDNRQYEYTLANGVLTAAEADGVGGAGTTFVDARVAFTGVTRTAGTETFRLPSPNPSGVSIITVPGSYHGVSGTYSCTPATPADGCSAAVAAQGFTLSAGDTWTFRPGNANAPVMESADTVYASYGWWLRKSADGQTFTASAFHDYKGTAGAVDIADLVAGTATYRGGAAGKYALSSTTGGTNDAGHFTARATLTADFADDTIKGTIDDFHGADGMHRDWSVELKTSAISTTGGITGTAADAAAGDQDTVWTIGGTDATDAAIANGAWSGNLREEGTDGVPAVATGVFYTEFNRSGKMVGAFGATK